MKIANDQGQTGQLARSNRDENSSVQTTVARRIRDNGPKVVPSRILIHPHSDLRASLDFVSIISGFFTLFVSTYFLAFGWTEIPPFCLIGAGISDSILIVDIGATVLTG
jgi:hypothetical protein